MLCLRYDILVSFLSERRQFVSINQNRIEIQKIKYRVTRGSILDPLLFILFIIDIPKLNKHANADLYANDTALKTQSKKSKLTENHEKSKKRVGRKQTDF